MTTKERTELQKFFNQISSLNDRREDVLCGIKFWKQGA